MPETTAAVRTTAPPGLKRECLSFPEVAAQSVANIAPSATPALIAPLVFADAGAGTWLSYVLATVALLLVTSHINTFARRSVSPGSLYLYISQGLGPAWGVLSGWCLINAYLFTAATTLAGAANYLTVLFHALVPQRLESLVGVVGMLAVGVLAWWVAYQDIQLSTRSMLALEFASIALILIVAAVFLMRSGAVVDVAQLHVAGVTAGGIRRGLVLAIFSFVGFESATTLGEEAKDPLHSIPRSVLLTVLAVGAMFTFMSYVLVLAFRGQPVPLNQSNAPLNVLARLAGIPALGVLISVGAVISFFACALASLNAGARVLYAMARHGIVHASAGTAHRIHATPHIAVTAAALGVLAIPLTVYLRGVALTDIFGYLGSLATFGFLCAYVLISLAAPAVVWRRERHLMPVATSALALALLALPIVGSVYPVPAGPDKYLPAIFVALMLAGTTWFAYLWWRRPHVIREMEADLLGPAEARPGNHRT
jgi:amino acid transporter